MKSPFDALEEHALKMARYSEIIAISLQTLTETTAGASGSGTHGDALAHVEGHRKVDALFFAQMSY
jgi:hypothetical protein